jgi:hypothetical protein
LHREAQAFNSMLDHLENRIQAINLQSALVTQAYEAVARRIQEQASDQITPALQMLEEEMSRFKTCLAECELQTRPSHNQRPFECTGSSGLKSSTVVEAA